MNEQRFQAYVTLIQSLLNCYSDEEFMAKLQANSELLDEGLIAVTEKYAAWITEQGDEETGERLLSIGAYLKGTLRTFKLEDYLNFLVEIIDVVGRNSSPESVYPLLKQNLDKLLNESFDQIFKEHMTRVLSQLDSESVHHVASVIFDFSILINQFPLGNKTNNQKIAIAGQEVAIAGYEVICTLCTQQTHPYKWANAQYNLGVDYYHRFKGEKAENLEKAINAYENALQVFTRQYYPDDWARTLINQGKVYCERFKGDKDENLEKSITACENALQVFTQQAYPDDWARTQINLGGIYDRRLKGDKAENQKKAIAACENALQVFTQEAYPYEWASVQNNLGAVYNERIEGERIENLKKAINYLENALSVYTLKAYPYDWAKTQKSLGAVHHELFKVENNAENRQKAINFYENALQVLTRQTYPHDWADTQHKLGLIYLQGCSLDDAENMGKGINCLKNALQVHTLQSFPIDCLEVSQHLGAIAFFLKDWRLTIEACSQGIEALERVRSWSTRDKGRQEIMAEAMQLYHNIVLSYISLGQIEKALEYADRSRSKQLVDLMASRDLSSDEEIPPAVQAYLTQYEHLQDQIHSLRSLQSRELAAIGTRQTQETKISQADIEQITALEAQKQEVWEQMRRLDPVIAGEIQVSPLSFAEMQALIDSPTTALVSFYSTSNDTYIFILYQDKAPQYYPLQGEGIDTLQNWIYYNWFSPYLRNLNQWRANIETVLQELSQRLHLNDLIEKHLTGIEELIIVPHIFLHQIPFAALPLSSSTSRQTEALSTIEITRGMVTTSTPKPQSNPNCTRFGDRFRLRFAPSCQILNYCHQRPNSADASTLGIVEDASSDLIFTRYECETLAQTYQVPPTRRLQRQQATINQYRQLARQVHILHSSHHASFNPNDPLSSHLVLADKPLTLGQLMIWRFTTLTDVFISCCETNLTNPEVTDNFMTLAAGFLCAGARSVTSTLWSVEDFASALLAIFYYDFRTKGYSRPHALQKAQYKLRTLTGETLKNQYKSILDQHLNQQRQEAKDMPNCQELVTKIYNQKQRLEQHCLEAYPFASPYYWSGFLSQGMA